MNTSRLTVLALAGACLTGACTGRPSYWDHPVDTTNVTYGMAGGVAVVDDVNHRVVILTATADQELTAQSLPIGHSYASAATSPDGKQLFVLSSGDWPIQRSTDQLPELTVIGLDPSSFKAAITNVYTMSEPVSNLAIDPIGTLAPGGACMVGKMPPPCPPDYAVGYQGPASTASPQNPSFAQNPNEIVIFNLAQGVAPLTPGSPTQPPYAVSRSIRSYGGTPQHLTFSPSLNLPANSPKATARRLLLIETNLDVSIVDLSHAFDPPPPTPKNGPYGRPEITVQLTSGTDTTSVSPTGLVVDPNADDGRVAFFTTSDSNVYTLQLLPSAAGAPNDFNPQINLTDVGGNPSDIEFVRTDQGLRVAALVPSKSSAVLIEPDTSVTTPVGLASAYSSMSLVTNIVSGASANTDVALLWSAGNGVASGVALWELGTTVGQPYRSIEVLQISAPIQAVLDVSGANDHLKVLSTTTQANGGGGDFFVLDLVGRTANPIHTNGSSQLTISPDGQRVWAYDQSTDLASVDLTTLNPTPLTTDAPISTVYDVASLAAGGRSLIAINAQGTFGATVFNATTPEASAREDVALLLEAP